MQERKIKYFTSLEEENRHEAARQKNMTVEERLAEFAVLQERRWGKDWTKKPIAKKVVITKSDYQD